MGTWSCHLSAGRMGTVGFRELVLLGTSQLPALLLWPPCPGYSTRNVFPNGTLTEKRQERAADCDRVSTRADTLPL